MSKAFTRESDDAPEPRALAPLRSALPPGTKNYLTPNGARQMQAALDALLQQRTSLAATDSTPETKSALQNLDQRILRLRHGLESAVITPPPAPPWEQVRFGATVTVKNQSGESSLYRIVGVDETDLDRDWVSWLSPIARALLNAKLGERVRFKFPDGEAQLEIVAITYE